MSTKQHTSSSLRRAIWRGCAIIAPPLVTLLLLLWIGNAIEQYILTPLETAARSVIVWRLSSSDVLDGPPPGATAIDDRPIEEGFDFEGTRYIHPPIGRRYLPDYIVGKVDANIDRVPYKLANPQSATDYYHAFVKLQYMPRWWTIPLLLLVFLSVLYFVGRFLAAGVGRFFVTGFERLINQLPLVRNLYSSVKQVTDFVLSEREIEFTRVVAVEYPRVGIWSIGFVTSDSLPTLRNSLGEDLVSIFVPTSPMPMTGFTVNVRKREVVDLELTIDQAVQFIVSCGVVCPTQIPNVGLKQPQRIDRPRPEGEAST
ncbi:MAG: DUF502 domain-containing protein [bacterium]|nr:DUF502 domain-containing protein [bacterium]